MHAYVDLKPLIEDGNLQVYICTVCMHEKEPQESPKHTSEHVKISKFPGNVPPDPLTQSICGAPIVVFALDLPNPLGGPAYFATVVTLGGSEWALGGFVVLLSTRDNYSCPPAEFCTRLSATAVPLHV